MLLRLHGTASEDADDDDDDDVAGCETAWGVAVYSDNRWGIVLRHVLVFTSNARGAAL